MGIFESFFTEKTSAAFTATSERDAWMCCAVASIYADGVSSDVEIARLTAIFGACSVFGYLGTITEAYRDALTSHQKYGGKALVDGSISFVHFESRPTLFAKCTELVLADGVITDEEKEILQYIATKFEITDEMAKRIIEVLLIKNKRDLTYIKFEE